MQAKYRVCLRWTKKYEWKIYWILRNILVVIVVVSFSDNNYLSSRQNLDFVSDIWTVNPSIFVPTVKQSHKITLSTHSSHSVLITFLVIVVSWCDRMIATVFKQHTGIPHENVRRDGHESSTWSHQNASPNGRLSHHARRFSSGVFFAPT